MIKHSEFHEDNWSINRFLSMNQSMYQINKWLLKYFLVFVWCHNNILSLVCCLWCFHVILKVTGPEPRSLLISPNPVKRYNDNKTKQILALCSQPSGLWRHLRRWLQPTMHRGAPASSQANSISGSGGLKGRADTDGLPGWNPIASLFHLMPY